MKQTELADRLGFTMQQVQKYESADNRISASVLGEIADIFGVPVSYFFAGLEPGNDPPDGHLTRAETLKLVRFYYEMPESVRSSFLQMVKAVAKLGRGSGSQSG
jgi:transcriptional regulator with XRE-family HTH domain